MDQKGGGMLASSGLWVVLGIALVVFGPKRLPELTKSIRKALREFMTTTEEIKQNLGGELKGAREIRTNLAGLDLLAELAERVSASMSSEETTGDSSHPSKDSKDRKVPPKEGTQTSCPF